MIKKLLIAFSIAALPSISFAQQWPNVPLLGGDTYCSSTVNSACVNTVPAGPAVTGAETIPADTNAAGGANPQTVKIPITELGGGLTTVSVPVTGDTLTATQYTRQLIVNPAGTLANLTINFPAASSTMVTGQRIGVCGTQIISSLTMGAGTGNTFSTTAPTAMLVPVVTGAASCFGFVYSKTSSAAGVWHRFQ